MRIGLWAAALLGALLWRAELARDAAWAQPSDSTSTALGSEAARQSFVIGYRAYAHRDFNGAIAPLQVAVPNLPDLTDYALFYLAASQMESADPKSAMTTYRRLVETYPQSVFAERAELDYGSLELKSGNAAAAEAAARRLLATSSDAQIEQNAHLLAARAALEQNKLAIAYEDAQSLRERAPRGINDAAARAIADEVVGRNPAVRGASLSAYYRREAALLEREGRPTAALERVQSALALPSSPADREELYWIRASAQPDRQAALARYLRLEPNGRHAANALDALGHLYWRSNDTAKARQYFSRLAFRFPGNELAPEAMFQIGRSFEDDRQFDSARAAYLRLIRRYPHSEAAANAQFRAPFMLYMKGDYDKAADEFETARLHANAPADRDMYSYWQARALEQSGEPAAARPLYRAVAMSTASNYYPALAGAKVPAEPEFTVAPALSSGAVIVPHREGAAGFHLARIAALRVLGLRELEPPELRVIAHTDDSELRRYALEEYQSAGDWYDAIQLATGMVARTEIGPSAAEAIRYPRGYWDLLSNAAAHRQLNPWLLAALIRQESLFNPQARSVSDARGLMQLLPSTATRWAPTAGLSAASLDLFDPQTSVQIGTAYLHGLFDMFGGDPFRAVAAYNGGEHAVAHWNEQFPGDDDQWVENIGYRETRDYVKKVIGGMREYQLLYERKFASSSFLAGVRSPG